MTKKSSGRHSVIQNLNRMDTASKSQCMYMDRLLELFGDRKPELTALVESMRGVHVVWLDLVEVLRKQI